MQTVKLPLESDKYKELYHRLTSFIELGQAGMQDRQSVWEEINRNTRQYLDSLSAQQEERRRGAGGKVTSRPPIRVPYSYSMIRIIYSYLASVFLSRDPIYEFMGRNAQGQDREQKVSTLIDYQLRRSDSILPLYQWLQDAAMYNVGIVQYDWVDMTHNVGTYGPVAQSIGGLDVSPPEDSVTSRDVRGYVGTKLRNINPMLALFDPRVPYQRVQEAEFFGFRSLISRRKLLDMEARGEVTNVADINHSYSIPSYHTRADISIDPQTGSLAFSRSEKGDMVEVITFYADINPRDWHLGDNNRSQRWVFMVANERTVIGAYPLGLDHNEFPVSVLELESDGYSATSRTLWESIEPFSQVIERLLNLHLTNQEDIINGTWFVDDTKVHIEDFNRQGPGRIIKARTNPFKLQMDNVVRRLDPPDTTASTLQNITGLIELCQRMVGTSDTVEGFPSVKGRRTAEDIRTTTQASLARLSVVAQRLSAAGWAQLARALVMTNRQFFNPADAEVISGTLRDTSGQPVSFAPDGDILEGFYDLKVIDGSLPLNRFAEIEFRLGLFDRIVNSPLVNVYKLDAIMDNILSYASIYNIPKVDVGAGISSGQTGTPSAQNEVTSPFAPPG